MLLFDRKLIIVGTLAGSLSNIAVAKEISSHDESPTSEVRFTKAEISEAAHPKFIQHSDFGTLLRDKIVLIATTLTSRQGGSNRALFDVASTNAQLSKNSLLNKLAIVHYEEAPFQYADSDKIRSILLGQTRKSGEVKFKEAFPLIEKFQKGLNFRWSFAGGSFDKKPSNPTPEIRYGLIVEDIQPQTAPAIASVGSISDSYWQYSRPARVVYTIDRIGNDKSTDRVFKNLPQEPAQVSVANTTPPKISLTERISSLVMKPSTDFDVKIEASNSEDSVSDKVSGGTVPGAKITLTQVEGLLSTQVTTNSRLGKETISFENKLPLVGEANITRKWDEKFHPVQTSLNNLLVSANAPKVNIHRFHSEEKFKGELLLKRTNFDLAIAIEPRVGWDQNAKLGEIGDKISLSFQNSF